MRRTRGAVIIASEDMRGKRFLSSWATFCDAHMEMLNSFETQQSLHRATNHSGLSLDTPQDWKISCLSIARTSLHA